MATLKVWNLSDATDRPRNLDLVGQSVLPGRYGLIPASRVNGIRRLVGAGVAFVGENPPLSYLAAKRKLRGQGVAKRTTIELPVAAPAVAVVAEAKPEPPAPELEVEMTYEAPESLQDNLEEMTKKQLRHLCTERGLESEGSKTEMLTRLQG